MITQRDNQTLQAIEKFKVMNTRQIHQAFYYNVTMERCRQRLLKLCRRGVLMQSRGHIDQFNNYHKGKNPRQLEHKLQVVNIWLLLDKPELFDVEYKIGNVKADAYTEVKRGNYLYSFFIEVHRHNRFDYSKYIRLYESGEWKRFFHVFPKVLIVTDCPVEVPRNTRINFIVLDAGLNDIDKIFL